MKVAQIVSTFPPYFGGMGNVAHQYARLLGSRGHQVSVLTAKYPRHGRWDRIGSRKTDVNELDVYAFQVSRISPLYRRGNAAILSGLARRTRDADIIHLHYPFIGAESILKTSRPMVMTYHMDLIGEGFKGRIFQLYQRIYLEQFLRKAERVIFTSKDYLEHSRAGKFWPAYGHKFSVLPLGVGEEFRPATAEEKFWQKRGIKEQRVVLFVGGLDAAHAFKGVDVLLGAATLLGPNVALVIVGDGNLKLQYQNQCRAMRLTNVYFMGHVAKHDLISFYQQCDFTVLPSINSSEAFGLVILESFACGRPAVASALPGVRSLISSGRDGLLAKPGDRRDLAARMKTMLSSNLRLMGEEAYRKAELSYRWPRLIDKLETIYKEAA